MENILVQFRQPTISGRLIYEYDVQTDPHLIFIKSAVRKRRMGRVNISSEILLGIDHEQIIESIEFIIPKRSWKVVPLSEFPLLDFAANLALTQETLNQNYFEFSVKVTTDEIHSYMNIIIGEQEQGGIWVELSKQCLALVIENRLKGFFIRLL